MKMLWTFRTASTGRRSRPRIVRLRADEAHELGNLVRVGRRLALALSESVLVLGGAPVRLLPCCFCYIIFGSNGPDENS